MSRDLNGKRIYYKKNFHDEKEWRFSPSTKVLIEEKKSRVIFKKRIQNEKIRINLNLESIKYERLWLKYKFEDICYLIVPDSKAREKMIKTIQRFPDDIFESTDRDFDKALLISKIQTIEDIRKDS